MAEEPRRVYANFTGVRGGAFDLLIDFAYLIDAEGVPETQVQIAMSWQHAVALIKLLQQQVDEYQNQVGDLPNLEHLRAIQEGEEAK